MITNSNWISSPVDIGEVCPIFSKDIKVSKQIKKGGSYNKCDRRL